MNQELIETLQDRLQMLKSDCEVFGATPEDLERMSELRKKILQLQK